MGCWRSACVWLSSRWGRCPRWSMPSTLALRQAKARDGKFPQSLAVLKISDFTVPTDRFVEKPLGYKQSGEGYSLYSVGIDLEDNGGTPHLDVAQLRAVPVAPRAAVK